MKLIKCFQKNGSLALNNFEQLLIDFIGRRIEMFLEIFDSRISSYSVIISVIRKCNNQHLIHVANKRRDNIVSTPCTAVSSGTRHQFLSQVESHSTFFQSQLF